MAKNTELSEKNFIHEGYSQNPFPFWLWLFVITAFAAILWGGSSWYSQRMGTVLQASPFLQVTNRAMSLFLWQNPEFMRIHAKNKNGYMPGFQYIDKFTLELAHADEYVVAPPEVLFRYHVWHRLLAPEFSPRPIQVGEFKEFLSHVEEWQPKYWPKAPVDYKRTIEDLTKYTLSQNLPLESIPQEVQQAFQGWKNYFKEGTAINNLKPTYGIVHQFLETHPHYARNYWRNIVEDTRPDYLKTYTFSQYEPKEIVPDSELTSFLKVALFNASFE